MHIYAHTYTHIHTYMVYSHTRTHTHTRGVLTRVRADTHIHTHAHTGDEKKAGPQLPGQGPLPALNPQRNCGKGGSHGRDSWASHVQAGISTITESTRQLHDVAQQLMGLLGAGAHAEHVLLVQRMEEVGVDVWVWVWVWVYVLRGGGLLSTEHMLSE